MFVILVAAASLLVQAYVFRDTPSHPFDRCAAERDLCPEEGLDSLLTLRAPAPSRPSAADPGPDAPDLAAGLPAPSGGVAARIEPRIAGE